MPSPSTLAMEEEWNGCEEFTLDNEALLWHYFTINEAVTRTHAAAVVASTIEEAHGHVIQERLLKNKLQQLALELNKRQWP